MWGERRTSVILQIEAAVAFPFAAFIIYTCRRFRKLRREVAFHLIINLAVADLGSLLALALGSPNDVINAGPRVCEVQAFIIQMFNLASLFWATAIAKALHHVVEHQSPITQVWKFHVFAWGLSFVLALLPLTTDSYGPAGAWCWIKRTGTVNTMWRALLFHVPAWLCIFRASLLYLITKRRLSEIASQGGERDRWRRLESSLKWFPAVMIFAWSGELVYRLHEYAFPRDTHYSGTIEIMQCVLGNGSFLQTIANSLVYGNSPMVRRRWARAWQEAQRLKSLRFLFWSTPSDNVEDLCRAAGTSSINSSDFHSSLLSEERHVSGKSSLDNLPDQLTHLSNEHRRSDSLAERDHRQSEW